MNDVRKCSMMFVCEKRVCFGWKNASKSMDCDGNGRKGWEKVRTHDCAADLVPLAFPPDFPPVILMVLGEWVGLGGVVEVLRWLMKLCVWMCCC